MHDHSQYFLFQVWSGFLQLLFKTDKTDYAQCRQCQALLRSNSKKDGVTNISRHSQMHSKTKIDKTQLPINKFIYNEKKLNNEQCELLLTSSVIGLCASNRPFTLLEDPGFLLILKALQHTQLAYGPFDLLDALPHRTTVANNLNRIKELGVSKLMTDISNLLGVSLTLDHWKDSIRQRVYLGFTISYVDMNLAVPSVVTRFLHIEHVQNKTDKLVKSVTKQVLRIFEVKTRISVTADNALNKLFSNDVYNSCMAHNFALFLKHAFWNEDKLQYQMRRKRKASSLELDAVDSTEYPSKVEKMFSTLYGDDNLNESKKTELLSTMQVIYISKELVSFIK